MMMKSLHAALALALLSFQAHAADCVDLTGKYAGEVEGAPTEISITQTACESGDMETRKGGELQSLRHMVFDGQMHKVEEAEGYETYEASRWDGSVLKVRGELRGSDGGVFATYEGTLELDAQRDLVTEITVSFPGADPMRARATLKRQ